MPKFSLVSQDKQSLKTLQSRKKFFILINILSEILESQRGLLPDHMGANCVPLSLVGHYHSSFRTYLENTGCQLDLECLFESFNNQVMRNIFFKKELGYLWEILELMKCHN